MLALLEEFPRRQILAEVVQDPRSKKLGAELSEEVRLPFSLAGLRDGFEMVGVTFLHDVGQIFVRWQAVTDQHPAAVRPQQVEDHILAPT